jgi:cytochrome P450
MDTPPLLVLVALLLPLVLLLLPQNGARARKGKNGGRLPPGPLAVPLLGNWQRHSVQHLVARYGPVVSLRVGTRLVVLVSDRRVAHAALVETGAALADRPAPARALLGETGHTTISRASYGSVWRLLRRNLVSGTLHQSRVRLFAPARAWARRALVGKLRASSEAPAGVTEELRNAVSCLLVLMCFGERLSESAVRAVTAVQRNWLLFTAYRAHVFAFWPAVTKHLFRRRLQMGLAAWRRQKEVFMPLIDARRERKKQLSQGGGGSGAGAPKKATAFEHSYVDTLFDIKLPDDGGRGLTDDELVSLCSEFLTAGTDTTSTALQWIMAELVKNPAIQEKLHSEIKATCGDEQDEVGEEDTRRMPYLKAVVLEGLRRHPPSHALLAHRAAEDIDVFGYLIPRGALVHFTVAEMGWDERVWGNPMEFSPERFLPGGDGEGVDVTGTKGVRMMPFGAGRRVCAGLGVAVLHLEYFVANLVREFEWQEVPGEEVDLAESHEITTVMKKPLRPRLVPRRIQRVTAAAH